MSRSLAAILAASLFATTAAAQQSAAPSASPAPSAAAQPAAPAQTSPATPAPAPPDPAPFKTMQEKNGYALGMEIGASFRKQGVELDPASVGKGFADAFAGGKTVLSEDEMRATLSAAQTEFRAKQEAIREEKAKATQKAGDDFLAANKAKDGVVTLSDGLQYKILKTGDGKKPDADDTVVCNYRGTFIDGTEFDSSAKHDGPATFPVKGVIPGWTEALQLMPVGSKWQLFVPPQLAYADRGAGDVIPPNSTLVFEVELVSISDKKPAANPGDKPADKEHDQQ